METIREDVLKGIHISPYIYLSTKLRGKARHAGGNMFRHQIDTFATLLDYGYNNGVLLKAALIHDLIEDLPDFNINELLNIDSDSAAVYALVMEVTKKDDQLKADYLKHIIKFGSKKAKILKCADRISNMISLGFVNDPHFIERYCDETEMYVFPIALNVNYAMYKELLDLVISRRKYLADYHFLHEHQQLNAR